MVTKRSSLMFLRIVLLAILSISSIKSCTWSKRRNNFQIILWLIQMKIVGRKATRALKAFCSKSNLDKKQMSFSWDRRSWFQVSHHRITVDHWSSNPSSRNRKQCTKSLATPPFSWNSWMSEALQPKRDILILKISKLKSFIMAKIHLLKTFKSANRPTT